MKRKTLDGLIMTMCDEANVDNDTLSVSQFKHCMNVMMLTDKRTRKTYLDYLLDMGYLRRIKIDIYKVTSLTFEHCRIVKEGRVAAIAKQMNVTDEKTILEIRKIV